MNFIFADTETTGVHADARVVEVAFAVADEDMNLIQSVGSLINPHCPIPAGASGVHGIVNSMVEDSPTLDEFMADYGHHFASPDTIFVAHNMAFDLRFLGKYLHPDAQKVCTLRLARRLLPDAENHKLQTLRYLLGLDSGEAHRATGDVTTLIDLFGALCEIADAKPLDMIALSAAPIPIRRIGFGKYKGHRLEDLPNEYVHWLLTKADNVDLDLRVALQAI